MTDFTIAIDFFFYSQIIVIITMILIIQMSISRKILLNCLTVCVILIPDYLLLHNLFNWSYLPIVGVIGLALFPSCLSIFINSSFLSTKKLHPTGFLISGSIVLTILLTTELTTIPLIIVYLLFFTLITIYVIFKDTSLWDKVKKLLAGALIIYTGLLIYSFYSNNTIILSLAAGFLMTSVFIIMTVKYFNRMVQTYTHIKRARQLNKRIIHYSAKLSHKSDQLKRIIQDKEVDLLLMSKHASLAEITAGIAHELTQPLTGIKGIAQNMIDDINYDEFEKLEAVSELLKICTLVDKSSTIINHIRNFSKKSSITMRPIDLNEVILNALDLIRNQLKKHHIELVLDLHDDTNKLYGDKIALEQLIINLVLNARDAIIVKNTKEPFSNGVIRILSLNNNISIDLIIEDNGIGISEDILKNIWSPFYTTKVRTDSSGIGLSISKKIIKEHNGIVTIDTLPGSGTKFIIKFPIKTQGEIPTS